MNNPERVNESSRRYADTKPDRRTKSDPAQRDLREKLEKTFDTSVNEEEDDLLSSGK